MNSKLCFKQGGDHLFFVRSALELILYSPHFQNDGGAVNCSTLVLLQIPLAILRFRVKKRV